MAFLDLEGLTRFRSNMMKHITDIIDGTTKVSSAASADNSAALDGHNSAYFATSGSVTALEDGTKAAGNAAKLGGELPAYYATKTATDAIASDVSAVAADVLAVSGDVTDVSSAVSNIVDGTTAVGNATLLDGHEASYFATQSTVDESLESAAASYLKTADLTSEVVDDATKIPSAAAVYSVQQSALQIVSFDAETGTLVTKSADYTG